MEQLGEKSSRIKAPRLQVPVVNLSILRGIGFVFLEDLLQLVASVLIIVVIFFTVYAVNGSAVLIDENGVPVSPQSVKDLHQVTLPGDFHKRLPFFSDRERENQWWKLQHIVSSLLPNHAQVEAVVEQGGQVQTVTLHVVKRDSTQTYRLLAIPVTMGVILLVFSNLLYLVYGRERVRLLSALLLLFALYQLSLAPLMSREISLNFPYFSWLVSINFLSICGLMLFPQYILSRFGEAQYPPLLLKSMIWIAYLPPVLLFFLYLYSVVSISVQNIVYAYLMIASLAAYMAALFVEKEALLKRYTAFNLASLVVLAFTVYIFYRFNDVSHAVQFNHFSGILFIFCFVIASIHVSALSYLDQMERYEHKLVTENAPHMTRKYALSKMYFFSSRRHTADADGAAKKQDDVSKDIEMLHKLSRYYINNVRYFLNISKDNKNMSWDRFVKHLENFGSDTTIHYSIFFEFDYQGNELAKFADLAVRVCLFHVFSEAMLNMLVHAKAAKFWCRLQVEERQVVLQLFDNGKGFIYNQETLTNGGGLIKLRNHIEKMLGGFEVSADRGDGCSIRVVLPLG